MSSPCSRTCAVVLFYCAVFFVHVSLTISVRNSQLFRTRRQSNSKESFLIDHWYRNHPSLRDAIMSENMILMLNGLKRQKRVSHHGRANKIWKSSLNTVHQREDPISKTSRHPPLINVKDIETPISRQKHGCKLSLSNDNIELDDLNRDPIYVARRAADLESTHKSSSTQHHSSTKSTLDKRRHASDPSTPMDVPVVITEIIEVGAPITSKNKLEEVTVQRRQANGDPSTTCITVTGGQNMPLDGGTSPGLVDSGAATIGNTDTPPVADTVAPVADTAAPAADTVAPISDTGAPAVPVADTAATDLQPCTIATPAPTDAPEVLTDTPAPITQPPVTQPPVTQPPVTQPPVIQPVITRPVVAPPVIAQPVGPLAGPMNNEPVQMIGLTAAHGALKEGPTLTTAVVPAVIPSQMSDTLSEILEDVEELADQKVAANEDFPCNINGSWISEAGGVTLQLHVKDNSTLEINSTDTVGKKKSSEGFLTNSTWSLTGTIPLAKKSMIIINGVDDSENKVATFIGECKVCHHTETVAGHWLLVNTARDCNDQKDNFKIFSDLWKREKLRYLKKQRLSMVLRLDNNITSVGYLTTCETVTPKKNR